MAGDFKFFRFRGLAVDIGKAGQEYVFDRTAFFAYQMKMRFEFRVEAVARIVERNFMYQALLEKYIQVSIYSSEAERRHIFLQRAVYLHRARMIAAAFYKIEYFLPLPAFSVYGLALFQFMPLSEFYNDNDYRYRTNNIIFILTCQLLTKMISYLV